MPPVAADPLIQGPWPSAEATRRAEAAAEDTGPLRVLGRPAASEDEGEELAADQPHCRLEEAALRKYADAVRRYCRSRTRTESDAEDAVQETFVRFLQHRAGDIVNAEAWLIAVASRVCSDLHRRANRERAASGEDIDAPTAGPTADPERLAIQGAMVGELFRNLRPTDRRLLASLYMADQSIQQVAEQLQLSEGNVRVMALRARRRAQAFLGAVARPVGAASGLAVAAAAGERLRAALLRAHAAAYRRVAGAASRIGNPDAWSALTAAQLVPALAVASMAAVPASVAGVDLAAGRAAPQASVTAPDVLPAVPPGAAAQYSALGSGDRSVPDLSSTGGPSSGAAHGGSGPLGTQLVGAPPGSTVDDAAFTSTTPSPDYRDDHTLFASGLFADCSNACTALFVSHDSGHTWTRLAASHFLGGAVLLPSDYASTGTMFAVNQAGLQRSSDGGRSFELAVPGVSSAAVWPGSPAGDPVVLLGTVPLALYDSATGLVHAGPRLPAGVSSVGGVAFTTVSGDFVVSAERVDPAARGANDSVLLRCALGGSCTVAQALAQTGGFVLAVSGSGQPDQSVAAFQGNVLELSRDGGASYSEVRLPSQLSIGAVAMTPETVLAAAMDTTGQGHLLRSVAGGPFQVVATAGIPALATFTTLQALGTGQVLGTMMQGDQGVFGVRCSSDGQSWITHC